MPATVETYRTKEGREPILEFLRELFLTNPKLVDKIFRSIDLLKEFGYKLPKPHMDYIEKDLFELRTILGTNIARIFYYSSSNDKFILLHAFIKKSQKIPLNELKIARKRVIDYKERFEK
jgi:phage-related protein